MTYSFRTAWRSDISTRAVDLALHVGLAIALPGHWWYQMLPDVLVPVMLGYSLLTNKWLPQRGWLVQGSALLHSPLCVLVLGSLCVARPWPFVYVMLHWGSHLTVDFFTHKNWKLRREEACSNE